MKTVVDFNPSRTEIALNNLHLLNFLFMANCRAGLFK